MEELKTIASRENEKIKELVKLSQKKYRHSLGKFKIENIAIISGALESGHSFQALFVTEDFIATQGEKWTIFQEAGTEAQFFLVGPELNKACSDLENPTGIIAVYAMQEFGWEENASVLYLNGVNDPGNVGTIMRTALAFDFKNIVMDEKCADIYNAKTLNASKDAIFKLNIRKDKDLTWLTENQNNFPIYAADSNGGTNLGEFQAEEKFCLVLGSESHGIDERVLQLTREKICIEISPNMESLNVAVAGAILLYELRADRKK